MKTQKYSLRLKFIGFSSILNFKLVQFSLIFCMLFFQISASYCQLDGLADKLESEIGDMLGSTDNKEAKLPASYSFDVVYTVEMTDKRSTNTMTYLIDRKDQTVAMYEDEPDELNIYLLDQNRKLSLFYAEGNGNKARSFLPYIDYYKIAARLSKKTSKSSSIKPTGETKRILGYDCEEYQFTNSSSEGYMYVAHELSSSSMALFGFQSPIDPEILSQANAVKPGLLLELNMHKLGKPNKNPFSMKCISFEEKDYIITNSEYTTVN